MLREGNSILILPADKVNTTVLLDHADYEKKVLELLNLDAYKTLLKDPTSKVQAVLNNTLFFYLW